MVRITTAQLAARADITDATLAEILAILKPAPAPELSAGEKLAKHANGKPTKSRTTTKSSRTKRAKAIDKRKAENLARGLNPQAQAICPNGHEAKSGGVRWGIQASWVCADCHEREELRFTTKLPAKRS